MAGIYSSDQQVSGLFGSIVIPQPGIWSTTSTSFANFGANGYGTTPVLTGNASVPVTKIPGITFATLPAGTYLFMALASFGYQGGGGGSSFFRFNDGTNSTSSSRMLCDTTLIDIGTPGSLYGQITYLTPQTNITIQVQGKRDTGVTGCFIYTDACDFSIHVYRMPVLLSNAGV